MTNDHRLSFEFHWDTLTYLRGLWLFRPSVTLAASIPRRSQQRYMCTVDGDIKHIQ